MCQIIAMTIRGANCSSRLLEIAEDEESQFKRLLNLKGEDYFSVAILARSGSNITPVQFSMTAKSSNFLFSSLKEILAGDSFRESLEMGIILFSRQRPEMEGDQPEPQPYFIDGGVIAVHGTIINDKELAEAGDISIEADTEIFKTYSISDDRVHGTFSCIQITNNINIITRDNGLKLWRANLSQDSVNVISTGNLDFLNDSPHEVVSFPVRPKLDRILFAAFSGGMDIALSTHKALSTGKYKMAILNYFDWESAAATEELKNLSSFSNYYSEKFNVEVYVNVIDAKKYFNSFFDIADIRTKLNDTGAIGDSSETESPIAYVPYRNSQFALVLASSAEGKEYKNIDLLFGLNLSEGMVFGDNSEGWLNAIQETVRYGGKSFEITGGYNVIAPYFPRTKTNLVKEFLEEFGSGVTQELLDLSFSCYYPKEDGLPCDECGSCILREKAIEKIQD